MSEHILTNLVVRLRNYVDDVDDVALRVEAADELERLRGNLSLAEEGLASYAQENARLRKALEQASYALFQLKRMTPEAVPGFAREASDKAQQALDGAQDEPFERCSSCDGSGLALNMAGEPDECPDCKGNTVVPHENCDETLRPCPFCDSEAKIENAAEVGPNSYVVCCQNPNCMSSSKVIVALKDNVERLLIEAWNRRALSVERSYAESVEHP